MCRRLGRKAYNSEQVGHIPPFLGARFGAKQSLSCTGVPKREFGNQNICRVGALACSFKEPPRAAVPHQNFS
jgi:hypothetical protein